MTHRTSSCMYVSIYTRHKSCCHFPPSTFSDVIKCWMEDSRSFAAAAFHACPFSSITLAFSSPTLQDRRGMMARLGRPQLFTTNTMAPPTAHSAVRVHEKRKRVVSLLPTLAERWHFTTYCTHVYFQCHGNACTNENKKNLHQTKKHNERTKLSINKGSVKNGVDEQK